MAANTDGQHRGTTEGNGPTSAVLLQCPACGVRLAKEALKAHLSRHIKLEEADMGGWVLERPCAGCGVRLPMRDMVPHLYTHLGERCPDELLCKTKKKLSVRRKKRDRTPPNDAGEQKTTDK